MTDEEPEQDGIVYLTQGECIIIPMEWLFSWEVTSVVVGIFIAIGLGVLALDDFRLAKAFFLLAAADAVGGVVMWGTKLTLRSSVANVIVFVAVGAIGLIAFQALRYVDRKRQAKEPKLANTEIQKLVRRIGNVPAGMTLTPDAGDIRIIFKSSPFYTAPVKKRITHDLTRFRDYLIQLGIPVPKDLPPIGTTETKEANEVPGEGFYTPPGLPVYRGGLTLDKTMVNNRDLVTKVYCDYVMDGLLTGPDSPFNVPGPVTDATNLAGVMMISNWLSTYLNFSFWNRPQKKRPFALQGFLPGALWDIREKFGREFTDQMLGFTVKAMRDEPMENASEKVDVYFVRKLKIGESVIDNDGSSWLEIEEILHKHKFPFL